MPGYWHGVVQFLIYGTIVQVAVVGDVGVCFAGFSRLLAVPTRGIDWYSREKRKKVHFEVSLSRQTMTAPGVESEKICQKNHCVKNVDLALYL